MEQKVLDIIKEEYKQEILKIEKYNELKQRMNYLERFSVVKEYKQIEEELEELNNNKKSSTDILYNIYINKIGMINETLEIYVYMGTYSSGERFNIRGTVDQPVSKNDANADYNLYVDIEKGLKSVKIPISQCETFEKHHIILEANNFYEYNQLQKQFIEDLVINGMEEAIEKIKKKTNKN